MVCDLSGPQPTSPSLERDTMLKLIAIDVDGTLLDSKHQLSDENKKWIQFVVSQGTTLALASGRPLHGLFDVYEQL